MLFSTLLVLLGCVGMFCIPAFRIEGLQAMFDLGEIGITLVFEHHPHFHLPATWKPLGRIQTALGHVRVEDLRQALANHERRHADTCGGDLEQISALGIHLAFLPICFA